MARRRLPVRPALLAGAAVLAAAIILAIVFRQDLSLLGVADMHSLAVDDSGYQIQPLAFHFTSSFARGHDVYLADADGRIFHADDRDGSQARQELGLACPSPRMIFAASDGTLLVSPDFTGSLLRSADGGNSWQAVLDRAAWRMDEDPRTGALYVGAYNRREQASLRAAIFKSIDRGLTWQRVFDDPGLDHIHTIRCDGEFGRVYFAAGDKSALRGQGWSDDEGGTWSWINRGRYDGHTDLALTDRLAVWGSDDQYGRIILSPRNNPRDSKTVLCGRYQQIWFVVAAGRQIYAGTSCLHNKSSSGAFLLASGDEGQTWRKLMTLPVSADVDPTFFGDSRYLSADGWLYFSTTAGKSYRVRAKR